MTYQEKVEKLSLRELQNLQQKYEQNVITPNIYDFNVFSILNLRENSHTEILAWLLDAKDKSPNSIQYQFLKQFLHNDYLHINDLNLDIDNLIPTLEITYQTSSKNDNNNKNGQMDIFMVSKPQKFVCVIEVKLDAKISINKDDKDQLSRYRKYLDTYYKDYKQGLIFLCTSVKKQVEGKKRINDLLTKLKYQVLEYSDIALILYKILPVNYTKTNGIKEYNEITFSLLKDLVNVLDNENKRKIESFIPSINEAILEKPITKRKGLNATLRYEEPKNCNIELFEKLQEKSKNSDFDFIYKFLNQYIKYWEHSNKFVKGYSQIVDGFYIDSIKDRLASLK